MESKNHILLAIHATDRVKHASQIQKALTEYGCYIKTRLGLHQATEDYCSPGGLIVLELLDNEEKACGLENELNKIEGLETKKIVFKN